ncbi:MAG: RidA family protein [Spirochaetes bacterium]|nr:RidA family protein [Spirochaetota bacterium]
MSKEIIYSKNAPEAIGPYSQAVVVGKLIFISGQLPINPQTKELIKNNIKEATEQILINISNILKEKNLTLNNIIKTTIFLKDLSTFQAVNEVYSKYFKNDFPARSTIEVSKLPKEADIEIEAIAFID